MQVEVKQYKRRGYNWVPWLFSVVCLGAAIVFAYLSAQQKTTPMPDVTFDFNSDEHAQWNGFSAPVFSPDGSHIVFSGTAAKGKSYLFLRSLDSPIPRPITETDGGILP